jgi:hypothetical protein
LKSAPGKYFVRPYLEKIYHKKRAGRVAQVVRALCMKYEALRSNSSTTKKKKKKKKEIKRY